MERELLERGPVLDKKGRPVPGYSKRSTVVYEPESPSNRCRRPGEKNSKENVWGFLPEYPMTPSAYSIQLTCRLCEGQ